MLLLLFSVDNDDFVIDSAHIQEIIPRLNLKYIPTAHPYILGTHDLRGAPLLILDFKKIVKNSFSADTLLTRTIILKNDRFKLGLIAENVRETVYCEQDEIQTFASTPTPYLSKYICLNSRSVTFVDIPLLFKVIEKDLQ
jgi:chemotaxis-related protein WspB